MSSSLSMRLQHSLNALHVYARLCRRLPQRRARKIARVYERIMHPFLYTTTGARK